MKVRVQPAGLCEPLVVNNARTLVLYDDFDQPITVATVLDGGGVAVSTAKDPNFRQVLSSLGIGLNASIKVVRV